MSATFQGLVDSGGRVLLKEMSKAETPGGFIAFRGLVLDANGYVAYIPDAGQPRLFRDGLAFDSVAGLLLTSAGPVANISMGGLAVSASGAVVTTQNPPDVIHQGVGLQDDGALSVSTPNIATEYIKDFNNWQDSAGVSFIQGDFYGREGVWVLENLATSGVTMVFDFSAEQASGGPVLIPGQDYEISVDMYSPSSNTQPIAGSWYTSDTLGSRSGVSAADVWENVTTSLTFTAGDDLFANAFAPTLSGTIGDKAAFDLNTIFIRAV